jgi:hypothetical protein
LASSATYATSLSVTFMEFKDRSSAQALALAS